MIAHGNVTFSKMINFESKFYNMALEITDANFEETVLKSDKPVIVENSAVTNGDDGALAP